MKAHSCSCPSCGAKVGEPCKTRKGQQASSPHTARRGAFRQLVRELIAERVNGCGPCAGGRGVRRAPAFLAFLLWLAGCGDDTPPADPNGKCYQLTPEAPSCVYACRDLKTSAWCMSATFPEAHLCWWSNDVQLWFQCVIPRPDMSIAGVCVARCPK